MKKAFLIALLGCFLLVGCGTSENETIQANASIESTSEVMEESSTMESESEAIVESSTMEKEEVVETTTPTQEPTPTPTQEPTPTPTQEPTPTPTQEPTPTPTQEPTPIPTQEPTPTPTQEPTPIPTQEPIQSEYGDGSDLEYSGSITLPSGATMVVLNKFNRCGLDPNNSFWGDWDSQIVANNMQTYISGLDGVVDVWGSGNYAQDFAYSANSMQWYKDSFGNYPHMEIKRDSSEYYTLVLNTTLDVDWANQNGVTFDSNDEARSREALVCILACVSSTPNEIKDEIIYLLYAEDGNSSRIPLDYSWANVGDCKIKLSAYNFENGEHIVVFYIKGK